MPSEIFVTGLGVVSAIGTNTEQNYTSLIHKKSGLGSIEILPTVHKDEFKVGEIKLENTQLTKYLGLTENEADNFTRTALLGLIAAKEAVENSGIRNAENYSRTAFVSATTVGGMDKTETSIRNSAANLNYLLTHPCGSSTNTICKQLGISGYRTTISTACSSGINAIIHGVNLIRSGYVDKAIVGGVDALSKFTLNGFNSLMILDKDYCKPFDQNRNGLNLGEGAGFLVIESKQSLLSRGKKPICSISGFANANDAFHQTASSPNGDGAFMAMSSALEMSKLKPTEIDYVNAHGTGTPNNDLSESVALNRVFGQKMPKYSSTKAYTGHTLGAAASIESVFSVLAIQKGVIYPNLNFSKKIEEYGTEPQLEVEHTNVNHVLSNSFGFGGNNSSIIFSKVR